MRRCPRAPVSVQVCVPQWRQERAAKTMSTRANAVRPWVCMVCGSTRVGGSGICGVCYFAVYTSTDWWAGRRKHLALRHERDDRWAAERNAVTDVPQRLDDDTRIPCVRCRVLCSHGLCATCRERTAIDDICSYCGLYDIRCVPAQEGSVCRLCLCAGCGEYVIGPERVTCAICLDREVALAMPLPAASTSTRLYDGPPKSPCPGASARGAINEPTPQSADLFLNSMAARFSLLELS
jgi:hypothetical protein